MEVEENFDMSEDNSGVLCWSMRGDNIVNVNLTSVCEKMTSGNRGRGERKVHRRVLGGHGYKILLFR